MGDEVLTFDKAIRLLGVILDPRLTGAAHVNMIRKDCQSRLNLLKAVRGIMSGLSSTLLLCIFRGFVRPKLDFGAPALLHLAPTQLERLAVMENQGLRIALTAFQNTSVAAV